MRIFPKVLVLLATIAAFSVIASAQLGSPAKPPEAVIVSGGILNAKATNLPKAEYPVSAAREKAVGKVAVFVLVNESGAVEFAEAKTGHPLLKQAAVDAARQATFPPLKVKGKPVKVSGTINYEFILETRQGSNVALFSLVLNLAKHLAETDAAIVKDIFGEKGRLFENWEDPDFGEDFKPLVGYEEMTPEKRREVIDTALAAIEAKSTAAAEKWQFKVGRQLGEMYGPIMLLASKLEKPSVETFSKLGLKEHLLKLDELARSAPTGVPAFLLKEIQRLADFSKSDFAVLDDYKPVVLGLDDIFNALGPK